MKVDRPKLTRHATRPSRCRSHWPASTPSQDTKARENRQRRRDIGRRRGRAVVLHPFHDVVRQRRRVRRVGARTVRKSRRNRTRIADTGDPIHSNSEGGGGAGCEAGEILDGGHGADGRDDRLER